MSHGGGSLTQPARCTNGKHIATFFFRSSRCMWRSWKAKSFAGSKLAGALVTRSSENDWIISSRVKSSVLSSSDQPSSKR